MNHEERLDHRLLEHVVYLFKLLQTNQIEVDELLSGSVYTPLLSPQDERDLRIACEIMDEMPGGFLIYSADEGEEIIYATRGLLRIFRCGSMQEFREHTGNSFRGVVHPEDLESVEKSIQSQVASSQYDLDYAGYRIIRRDGSVRWIEDYGHFIRTKSAGNIFYVFFGDATDKKSQQQLEQRRMLEEALDKANVAVAAKNTFLSNISHDMRTPLNAILGFTALAKVRPDDPHILLDYLARVEAAGNQLLDMIAKALEVSALSTPDSLAEMECDLCESIREVYDFMLPQAEEKNIAFSLDCSGVRHSQIYADRERFKQLVLNLTNNAVTYTHPGGRVMISITEEEQLRGSEAFYHLMVKDTGIGISEEFLKRIFEPFSREKNSTLSGVHSIGLGLTIVKNIVDKMGGMIEVQSGINKGTSFHITFRFRLQISPAVGRKIVAKQSKRRILLVDDNEINREIESELLEKMGFITDSAENGKVALEKVEKSAPDEYDLVIMDIQMPVMDGWQAAAAIRRLSDPALANIPIIALSANVFESDQQKSKASGIDAHLPKPMNLTVLLETIDKLTERNCPA